MRYLFLFFCFLFFSLFFQESFSQDFHLDCDMPEIYGEEEVQSIQYKGMYVTSTGTLRVLVVFVRFADDNVTSSIWPDPNVKPAWIQNFVSNTYSPNGYYYSGTVSDYFYKNSYGNYHVIGDVYYVTLSQNESYYHEYAFTHTAISARGLIEMEALNIIDSAPYNVDFSLYDNWKYIDIFNTQVGQDGKLDMCWFITRSLNDQNYPANKRLGFGWAGLDCSTHIRDGVTIKGGGFPSFPTSGITIFRNIHDFGINPVNPQFGNFTNVNIVAHEMTHYLFGPGHFTQGDNSLNTNRYTSNMLSYVGGWRGMYSGYEKWRLGWMTPTPISTDGDYVLWDLASTTTDPNKHRLFKINIPGSSQFYLIENRSWISMFETRYNAYGGPNALLKPGIFIYQLYTQGETYISNSQVIKLDAEGRYKWKFLYRGSNSGNMWDDVIEKDYPDRINGYSETEYLFINNLPNEKWLAEWHPNTLTPYNGGCYKSTYSNNGQVETTDWSGDSLDIFGVGSVITPWSNPGSFKWTATGFEQTNIGIEIFSYNSTNKTYTIRFRQSNPLDLSPSKPPLGFFHAGEGPIQYGWAYLAWGADYWDGQPIESDVNWSELQRKIGNNGTWQTVYSGSNRWWSDNSIIYDPQNGDVPVYFRVRVRDSQNKWSIWSELYDTRTFSNQNSTEKIKINGINNNIPVEYNLSSNYPNPFNPSTIINYAVKDVGLVSIKVYDILGSEVKTLVNETKEAGEYSVEFNASTLPSGVYIYTMQVNGFASSKKMLLMK